MNELPPRRDMTTLGVMALCLVIVATSWFLLQQLAMLLRPLLLAVFLAYVILPIHYRVSQRVPRYLSVVVLAGASMAVLYGLALMVYSSAVELREQLPRYIERAESVYDRLSELWNTYFSWLGTDGGHGERRSRGTGGWLWAPAY